MMNNTPALKIMVACPFCGNINHFGIEDDIDGLGECAVYCTECLARGPARDTENKAIKAWNAQPKLETPIHRMSKDILREKIEEIMTRYEHENYKDSHTDLGIGILFEPDGDNITEKGHALIEEIISIMSQ